LARQRRSTTVTAARHVSDAGILSGVLGELADVRRARDAGGWNDALAARALAALRIAASYDAGMPVAQTPAPRDARLLSGQLRVPAGVLRGGSVIISGAASTAVLTRLAQADGQLSARQQGRVEDMLTALRGMSELAYGREGAASRDSLDDAFAAGERAARAIRREHSWLAMQLRAVKQWAGDTARVRGWARS
jgi:hypothetical protein